MQLPLGPKDVAKFARMGWTFSGVPSVFAYPVVSLGVQISDSAAHWLDRNTLLWNAPAGGVAKWKLHHSAAADLAIDSDTLTINGEAVEATSARTVSRGIAQCAPRPRWRSRICR